MSGKRQFNYERALDRAMHVFWVRGYTRTSVRDLQAAMGVRAGSFYNAVGSKKKLYVACLKHYNATVTAKRWRAFQSAPSVTQGIRRYFRVVLNDLADPRTPQVCLMAASLSRDVLSDRELQTYVLGEMRALEAALTTRLSLAQRDGEVPRCVNADTAARVIVTFLQGLFRTVRTLHSRAQMEREVHALLAGLGLDESS